MSRKLDWHREDIKAELRKKNITIVIIAQDAGVSRPAVSQVLSGMRSEKIEQKIAEKLGLAPQDIWPSRYLNKFAKVKKS